MNPKKLPTVFQGSPAGKAPGDKSAPKESSGGWGRGIAFGMKGLICGFLF